MFIDNLFSYINNLKRFPIIFVSPLVYAVGNCAEEIYFALLKARKERKKVILLYPYKLPYWLVKYQLTNRELFRIDSQFVYFHNDVFLFHLIRLMVTIVYLQLRLASLGFEKYFNISLSESYRTPRMGINDLWCSMADQKHFSWEAVRALQWSKKFGEILSVNLRNSREELAKSKLREMGISEDDWFICVHVRESGFRNDAGRREYRNSHFENYVKALGRITEKGGWVIRMGDDTMTPLTKMERVIDYPFTKFKSDLMDVFLISECRFFIGCQSGPLDIASLFQKKTLIVNMVNWTFNYPWFDHSRGIVKHFYSNSENRNLTIKELFEGPWSLQDTNRNVSDEYTIRENSADEIEEAVVEYMNLVESQNFTQTSLQRKANDLRIKTSYDLFNTVRLTTLSNKDELIEKYRFASRVEDSNGAICHNFLKNNWD